MNEKSGKPVPQSRSLYWDFCSKSPGAGVCRIEANSSMDRFYVCSENDFGEEQSAQVRLEDDDTVFLSSSYGHVSNLRTSRMTWEEFWEEFRKWHLQLMDEAKQRDKCER